MPLLGLSTAGAKLARWTIRAAGEVIPAGLAWLADDLVANAEAPSTLEWRRFTFRWSRSTPATTVEDFAQFKLDLVNVTSDELDTSWTAGDYAAVAAAASTFRGNLSTQMAASQTWYDLRAYRMRFNPVLDVTRPFQDAGPPTYVASTALAGSGTSTMPYQLAPTVTLRTSWAKHWGRAYMPTPATAMLDANGRLTSTYRSNTATAFKNMLGTLHDAGFYPVIPVGQLNKTPFHALLGVTAVVVDDVPDVIRRRRPKQASARTFG